MSGISILRRLLLKEAVKGSGQASGIMSIGDNVRKLAEKRLQSYLLSAQKQGVDIDGMNEQQIKYMLEMNKPKAPRVISQGDPEFKGITEALLGKRSQVIEGKFGKPFKEEIGSVDNVINNITRMEPVAAMKEVNKVLRREGKYKNLSKQDSEKIFNDTDDWINQRDPADLYDYKNKRPFREDPNFDPDDPDFDPENFADGGVAGLLGERTGFRGGGAYRGLSGSKKSKSKSKSATPRGGGADMGTVSTPTRKANPNLVARAEAEQRKTDETNRRIAANRAAAQYELTPPKKSLRQKIGSGINRVLNFPLVRAYAFYGTGGASEKLRQAMLAKQLYDSRKYLMDETIEDEIRNIPTTGGISSTFFPQGDFLNIKKTATSPTDYNIKATKDLVENLPGGVVRDVLAPAAAGAMSLPYDAIQAAQRMKPGSGVSGFIDAFKAERPISSLKERTIGAAGPLAERFDDVNEEDKYDFSNIEGQTAFLDPVSLLILGSKTIGPAYALKSGGINELAKYKIRKDIANKGLAKTQEILAAKAAAEAKAKADAAAAARRQQQQKTIAARGTAQGSGGTFVDRKTGAMKGYEKGAGGGKDAPSQHFYIARGGLAQRAPRYTNGGLINFYRYGGFI